MKTVTKQILSCHEIKPNKSSGESLQFQGQSQVHGSLQSISKVDKQHFFLQTFPMCPTWNYHDLGSYLHKRGLQQTAQLVLSWGWIHSEQGSYLNQKSDPDPLQRKSPHHPKFNFWQACTSMAQSIIASRERKKKTCQLDQKCRTHQGELQEGS